MTANEHIEAAIIATRRALNAMREFGEEMREANQHMVGYHMLTSDQYTLNAVCRQQAGTDDAIDTQIRNLEINLEALRVMSGRVVVVDNRLGSGHDRTH